MSNESYRDKLRKRQHQEHQDKGKTGLGRIDVLDHEKAGRKFNIFTEKRGTKKEDENAIDIMPFRITQEWYKDLRMPSGRRIGLDVGDLDYKLQVPVHPGMGPNKTDRYLCLREAFGQPCSRCDDMFQAYKDGDKEKGKEYKPAWRTFYCVFDLDDQSRGYQLWEISYFMFESTTSRDPQRINLLDAQMLDDGGIVVFSDLEEGSTVIAKFKEMKMGKNPYGEVYDIGFEGRDPYPESVLDEVLPLDKMLIIPDYETVRSAHYLLEDTGSDNDTPEEQRTNETRTRLRGESQSQDNTPPRRQRTRENRVDAPDFDKDGEWGQCPAGHNFGYDCNKFPECEGKEDSPCTEEHFRQCAEKMDKLASQKTEPPKEEKEPEPAKVESGGRRRRRR